MSIFRLKKKEESFEFCLFDPAFGNRKATPADVITDDINAKVRRIGSFRNKMPIVKCKIRIMQ